MSSDGLIVKELLISEEMLIVAELLLGADCCCKRPLSNSENYRALPYALGVGVLAKGCCAPYETQTYSLLLVNIRAPQHPNIRNFHAYSLKHSNSVSHLNPQIRCHTSGCILVGVRNIMVPSQKVLPSLGRQEDFVRLLYSCSMTP